LGIKVKFYYWSDGHPGTIQKYSVKAEFMVEGGEKENA
jgi:hypothetical protein